jgi:16S rRNA (cytosine967-C5)-methyltransferase
MVHPNALEPERLTMIAEILIESLDNIITTHRHADKELQTLLKTTDMTTIEKEFLVVTLYDMLRNLRLLQAIAQTPGFNSYVFTAWLALRNYPANSNVIVEHFEAMQARAAELSKNRAMRYSLPDWLDTLCANELGEVAWEREIAALHTPAQPIIRTNLLKTTRQELLRNFKTMRIEAKPLVDTECGIILSSSSGIFRTNEFQNGHFEMQDANSQMIAPLTGAKPKMRVIDACAGAGGKAIHLAQIMNNKGKIIALDTSEKKLEALRQRAARAGVSIIEPRQITSTKTIKRLKESADIVLIDAPCTGLGVLRRNPEAKYNLKTEQVESLHKQQQELLVSYSRMTKLTGTLVYSVCSILPSEGEIQVRTFVENHPDWILSSERRFSPANDGFDGFYIALFKRKEPVAEVKAE